MDYINTCFSSIWQRQLGCADKVATVRMVHTASSSGFYLYNENQPPTVRSSFPKIRLFVPVAIMFSALTNIAECRILSGARSERKPHELPDNLEDEFSKKMITSGVEDISYVTTGSTTENLKLYFASIQNTDKKAFRKSKSTSKSKSSKTTKSRKSKSKSTSSTSSSSTDKSNPNCDSLSASDSLDLSDSSDLPGCDEDESILFTPTASPSDSISMNLSPNTTNLTTGTPSLFVDPKTGTNEPQIQLPTDTPTSKPSISIAQPTLSPSKMLSTEPTLALSTRPDSGSLNETASPTIESINTPSSQPITVIRTSISLEDNAVALGVGGVGAVAAIVVAGYAAIAGGGAAKLARISAHFQGGLF